MVNNLEKPLTALFSRVLFCIRLCPLYTRVCEDIGCAAALPMGVAPEASANRLRLGEGYVAVLLQPCPGGNVFQCSSALAAGGTCLVSGLLWVIMGSLELNNFIGGKILGSEGASSLDRPKC